MIFLHLFSRWQVKQPQLLLGSLSLMALMTSLRIQSVQAHNTVNFQERTSPANAPQLVVSSPQTIALANLPTAEQAALRQGKAIVTGEKGNLVGRVLIKAPTQVAWKVLTDYDNFEQFFPTIQESKLISSSGNLRVFEQLNVVRIFGISSRSRITLASTENYPKQITFSLVKGDLNAMDGAWQLEPVGLQAGASPTHVLVTQQVQVNPKGKGITRDLFFDAYRRILRDTLAAIKQETEQRANN